MHNKNYKKKRIMKTATATTTTNTAELYNSKLNIKINEATDGLNDANPPLKNLCLRGNQLCGSILIGNYSFLTQLEVSENEMEVLDLSSLAQLETLKCNRNKLMELQINGRNLTAMFAAHNCLHSITMSCLPNKLTYLDLSHNNFTTLPNWLGSCTELQVLHGHHNQLQSIAEFFATYRVKGLRVLNLAYNHIRLLCKLPERLASVEEVYLQSNELQQLPLNFFATIHQRLKVLNVSCNKLAALPNMEEEQDQCEQETGWSVTELMLSNNNLTEAIFVALRHATQVRCLHAAYNKISTLPESSVRSWLQLEELVLSGNMLQQLPANIALLTKLQVLRVHSNLLLATPTLSNLSQLRVLDLAHNHLDRINLLQIVPQSLKYLDLSCNVQLQVDAQQLQACQGERNWSLVDVSGKNRACLPTTKLQEQKDCNVALRPPWCLGFSETPGKCHKLGVSQLRLCNFRSADEALFGIFECAAAAGITLVKTLAKLTPQILQQERTVKDNSSTGGEYLKYTLLTAQQRLLENPSLGSPQLAGLTLCHITRESQWGGRNCVKPQKTKRYVLRVASVGVVEAYLVRKTTNVRLTQEQSSPAAVEHQTSQSPLLLPDPYVVEVVLSNEDEYLVLCNGHLWSVMDIERVARELRKEENVVLAAKRVQDIAQSFGATGNISVLVVRFRNVGTDVDHLIKELKQMVRRKPVAPPPPVMAAVSQSAVASSKRTCCERSNACRHRNGFSSLLPTRILTAAAAAATSRSERSSPSGQSDQALHPLSKHSEEDEEENALDLCGAGEVGEETDSVLSEEQFKCWEYMLEQNTQLLFDKELNTISKSFTKNCNVADRLDYKSNLLKNFNSKFISHSSPQLLHQGNNKEQAIPSNYQQQQQLSFLSRYFGSSRSFQATSTTADSATNGGHFFDGRTRDSMVAVGSYSKLAGGPNAAYFGSLQRLMPYNVEYDFAVTQERSVFEEEDDDYGDEQESRMRKYWGVATTEL